MSLKRPDVVLHLERLLGPNAIRAVAAGDGWPSLAEVWDGSEWRLCRLHVGLVGSSGRGRPDELRMQNPTDAPPIAQVPSSTSLILGLWQPGDGDEVLVAWDATRRAGRDTRFSLFVPLETVTRAQAAGRAEHLSAAHELVRAFNLRIENSLQALIRAANDGGSSTVQDIAMNDDLDEEIEGKNGELDAIAEKLAALSDGEVPSDFTAPPSPFESGDVNWDTNDWLARVADVQEWLKLDDAMRLENGLEAALDGLFAMMSDPNPSRCYTIVGGHASLTEPGIALLGARLDNARSLKESFQEDLEEGKTVAEATRAWREAWEDTPVGVDETRDAVHAKVDTWGIYQFRDRAGADDGLELNPSYQRGNVWTDKESSELIDSILRGIPLPSIILNQRAGGDSLEIVDGKQRLTAILRFIGSHPDARRFVATVEEELGVPSKLFSESYKKWRAAVKKKRGLTGEDEKKHFLPFPYRLPKGTRETGPLAALNGKYYCEIRDAPVTIQGRNETVRKVFELPMTSYKLSVILYEDTNIYQIHKVFGLYNRQGKKLNATEVRNAIYHHLALARLLLLIAGDSDDIISLAPYLETAKFDRGTVRELLKAINVSDSRFNRTKVTSWVAAILLHRIDKKLNTTPTTPGSTTLVESMMFDISGDAKPAHPMRSEAACAAFARDLCAGAALLSELKNQEAFAPKFTHPEKWEDIPAVAAWTACTLAAIAGVAATPATHTAMLAVTGRTEKLKKQQARSQWEYIARFVLDVLAELNVDTVALGATLDKRYGHNCLNTLSARRPA